MISVTINKKPDSWTLQARNWCNANVNGNWEMTVQLQDGIIVSTTFSFQTMEDATAFKLVWG